MSHFDIFCAFFMHEGSTVYCQVFYTIQSAFDSQVSS